MENRKKTRFLKKFRRKPKTFTCHGWPASNDIYRTNWIIFPEKDRWPALANFETWPSRSKRTHTLVSFKWLTWAWSTSFCLVVSSPRQATSWHVVKQNTKAYASLKLLQKHPSHSATCPLRKSRQGQRRRWAVSLAAHENNMTLSCR